MALDLPVDLLDPAANRYMYIHVYYTCVQFTISTWLNFSYVHNYSYMYI